MENISNSDGMAQPITTWQSLKYLFSNLVGTYLFLGLVEGAIEHAAKNKEVTWEIFHLDLEKVFAILVISIASTIFTIIKNHNKLLQSQNNFIRDVYPKITQDVRQMLFDMGENALKETLIESILSESVHRTPHKTFFHPYVLEQLRELRSFEEELAPAIEVLAKNRLTELKRTISVLKTDHASNKEIKGLEQVEMSKAFVKIPARKILFFDPKTYDNLNKWSSSFKHFIRETIKQSTAEKIQYLIFDDSKETNFKNDKKLMAYKDIMEKSGFKVHVISKSSLSEVADNINYNQRLEIYDDSVAAKIESKSDYSKDDQQENKISLTLSTIKHDETLKVFLDALTIHSIPIS